MNLPESLSPDAVSDLVARLGYPTDRRNVVLALTAQPVAGVIPSPRRGTPWSIPPSSLVDVLAALMLRRARRAGAVSYRRELPLERYRLPAAEIVMRDRALAPLVPARLRKQIAMTERACKAVLAERARERQAAIEAKQRAAERSKRWQDDRVCNLTRLHLYFDARVAASAARFPNISKSTLESPEYAEFMLAWPYPGDQPASWLPAPGALEAAAELMRPWVLGGCGSAPDLRHLLPALDYTQPWPWRAPNAV